MNSDFVATLVAQLTAEQADDLVQHLDASLRAYIAKTDPASAARSAVNR